MPDRAITITSALAGVVRSTSYFGPPPYACMDALNVRSRDQIHRRLRNGSRPGLKRSYGQELGGGNPINMLATVKPVGVVSSIGWQDHFNGTAFQDEWSIAQWSDANPVVAEVRTLDELLLSCMTFDQFVGSDMVGAIVRDDPSNWNQEGNYHLAMNCVPVRTSVFPVGTYRHYARRVFYLFMNPADPDHRDDGVQIIVTSSSIYIGDADDQHIRVQAIQTLAGVSVTKYDISVDFGSGVHFDQINYDLHVYVSYVGATTRSVSVFLNGVELHAGYTFTLASAGYHSCGIGLLSRASGSSFVSAINSFTFEYRPETQEDKQRVVVAASNGDVLIEDSGQFTQVTTTEDLRTDVTLQAVERSGKLYVADYSLERISGTSGVIAGAGNNELDDASVSDWTVYGIEAANDAVELFDVSGGAAAGVYKIATVVSGQITLASAPGAGNCSYRIMRAPKVVDVDAGTLNIHYATAGSVPLGCRMVGLYMDRIVYAGYPGRMFYMSRAGDPDDFDYSSDPGDPQRAVAGTSAPQAGIPGEDLTAMIIHSDDFILFCGENRIDILLGNPAAGGQIVNLSYIIGCVDRNAWCIGPGKQVILLSKDGIYSVVGNQPPVSLSRESLPDDLIDIDVVNNNVLMQYDVIDQGIHIFIVPVNTMNSGRHWWFDMESRGFWPVEVPAEMQPNAIVSHGLNSGQDTRVLLGGSDGYIRHFDRAAVDDDGTPIESFVLLGPIRAGGADDQDGVVEELVATLDENSVGVDWSLHPGDTGQMAVDADAQEEGEWTRGLNFRDHPMVRAFAFCIKVASMGAPWALESIVAKLGRAGPMRKL